MYTSYVLSVVLCQVIGKIKTLVTKHRLRLSDDIVNKMVCIKINKPFRDHLLKTVYYKRVLSIPGIEKVQDNDKE